VHSLAQVYKNQFNYTKAEPLYKQAIAISERTLGKYHPHVINRYRNLADMCEKQGKVKEAEKIWAIVKELKSQHKLENN
jgi:tetratricopeptide (TPR) repeat protein